MAFTYGIGFLPYGSLVEHEGQRYIMKPVYQNTEQVLLVPASGQGNSLQISSDTKVLCHYRGQGY